MTKFLIFERPFTRGFTREFPNVGSEDMEFVFMSDFRFRDDVDLIGRQYKHLRNPGPKFPDLDELLKDVIPRDRFLRSIDPALASRLAKAAYAAIEEIYEEVKPDAVIGIRIDNYYLHLMEKIAKAKGIYATFSGQSFLPNRTRISNLGEWRYVEEPDDELVEEYYQLLSSKKFKPATLSSHRKTLKLVSLYAREICKKALFTALKILKNDPYSFHYNAIFPAKWAITIHGPSNLFVEKFFESRERTLERIQEAKKQNMRIVFFPLQFSPESSLDYYISDINFSRYGELIDTIINTMPDDVMLVVKEHPDIYGFRRPSFYQRFTNRPNVILAHVSVHVSEFMSNDTFFIVTGGASTGAEAVVKGNTVITLGGAYYDGPELHSLPDWGDVPNWSDRLVPIANDEAARRNFVRRILQNTFEGPYAFARPAPHMLEKNRKTIKNLLAYIMKQL